MFKTSPEHTSVMITEAVVKDPGNFPDCGPFLGDLFGGNTNPPPPPTLEAPHQHQQHRRHHALQLLISRGLCLSWPLLLSCLAGVKPSRHQPQPPPQLHW